MSCQEMSVDDTVTDFDPRTPEIWRAQLPQKSCFTQQCASHSGRAAKILLFSRRLQCGCQLVQQKAPLSRETGRGFLHRDEISN